VTPQKCHPAVPALREAEAARNTSDVDVDQQRLIESADGDSFPDVPFLDFAIPDGTLCEVRPDRFEGEELTSPCVAEKAMVVVFRLGSGSCFVRFRCSNRFITGIYY
jgi:hypothetical protein